MFLQEKKEKTEFKTVQQKPEQRPGFANKEKLKNSRGYMILHKKIFNTPLDLLRPFFVPDSVTFTHAHTFWVNIVPHPDSECGPRCHLRVQNIEEKGLDEVCLHQGRRELVPGLLGGQPAPHFFQN